MSLADAHFVDCDKGTGVADTWEAGTQKRTNTYPQDYSHLEGETVDVVQDGVVTADQVVSGGSVTLTGTNNHVGLNYVSTLKPSKLDLEGMGLMLTKKLTKCIVSFYNTLKGKVGTTDSNLQTVSFGTELFEGIKEVPLDSKYEREGDVIIKQDEPMPMIARGMILNVGAYDK